MQQSASERGIVNQRNTLNGNTTRSNPNPRLLATPLRATMGQTRESGTQTGTLSVIQTTTRSSNLARRWKMLISSAWSSSPVSRMSTNSSSLPWMWRRETSAERQHIPRHLSGTPVTQIRCKPSAHSLFRQYCLGNFSTPSPPPLPHLGDTLLVIPIQISDLAVEIKIASRKISNNQMERGKQGSHVPRWASR